MHGSCVDILVENTKHMTVVEVCGSTAVVKLPKQFLECNHYSLTDGGVCLGSGAFGSVHLTTYYDCIKKFESSDGFYHELLACDLVAVAKAHSPTDASHRSLISYSNACTVCKTIFFPRYNGSLVDYQNWTRENVPILVREFRGLMDGIHFLNEKCGLFHADVSPCNILVNQDQGNNLISGLILSDLGIACLHTGNSVTNLALKSSRGRQLYGMRCERNPFLVCKDTYKPLCMLCRCYLLTRHGRVANDGSVSEAVGQKVAKMIDICSLAYCLLYAVERLLDSTGANPTSEFYNDSPDDDSDSKYYVQFLVPKVVLCEFLFGVWDVFVDLGVNSFGKTKYDIFSRGDAEQFSAWCNSFKAGFLRCLSPDFRRKIDDHGLMLLFLKLINNDYFGVHGRFEG